MFFECVGGAEEFYQRLYAFCSAEDVRRDKILGGGFEDLTLVFIRGTGGYDVVARLKWFATWAGAIFSGDVFVVVLTHKGVTCAALNEAAVNVAGCVGEVFVGF